MKKSLFIFAGEPSGDMHGARIIEALNAATDRLHIFGVGGTEIEKKQIKSLVPMKDFSVMGYTDVLKNFPKLWSHFRKIKKEILTQNPEIVLFIDAPSFSLRMAKALRKKGYKGKIIQYICPTVWAWGKSRIQNMSATFNLLLTIYPFEAKYFSHTDLKVEYVGNPVKEAIKHSSIDENWKNVYHIPPDRELIALFPGSRKGEIDRHLIPMLETAMILKKTTSNHPLFAICAIDKTAENQIKQHIELSQLILDRDIFIIQKEHSYALMQASLGALAKSGTVTLELALHYCPTVVFYTLTKLNRWIAKYLMKLDLSFFCITNILKNHLVFPEFIKNEAKPSQLALALTKLITQKEESNRCLAGCQEVHQLLGDLNPSELAAQAVLNLFEDIVD